MAPSTTSQIPTVVREIESRVEQLIADHKRLTKLNGELIQQRNSLIASKQEMQERIAKLEKELTMAQLKAGLRGGNKVDNKGGNKGGNKGSNAKAKAYINRLLREVDNCIAQLSSPGANEVAANGEGASEVGASGEAANEVGANEGEAANNQRG